MLKGENLFCVTPELRLWISLIHVKKNSPQIKKKLIILKAACKAESM